MYGPARSEIVSLRMQGVDLFFCKEIQLSMHAKLPGNVISSLEQPLSVAKKGAFGFEKLEPMWEKPRN